MAEALTEQHNSVRHITEDAVQSLNLKIENNLNEYIIIIVGNHTEGDLFNTISMISGEDRVKTFDDIEESLRFIDSWYDKNIFLIISGTLGAANAHKFATIPQITCLYKIRCIVSNPTILLIQLHTDIKQLSGRWPFTDKSFQKSKTITPEWYHLFLLAISHQPQYIEKSYREILKESRIYFKGNRCMLKQIDDFAQIYNSYNAIHAYTRDTFLYRIINHALRTQNIGIIKTFSRFITDLHSELHEN
ncbi:unnamed protein product [Rotaria socialis]|uniref:Uncharacterized protein n=1 Tax=Rotaria socialis TaxID=392032 RepID=A0A820XE69_9BILA|nr:unnamed protein product [Rotaria socialis]